MNRYIRCTFLFAVWLILLLGVRFRAYAQYCVEGSCNTNAYLKSSDPNTIEYDNIVSGHYVTIVREYDGKVRVWGQSMGQTGTNIAPPIELNGDNFGVGQNKLTGSVLRFAVGGGNQYAVLTTEGLYVWGTAGQLISSTIYNVASNSFRKVSIGTYNVNGGALKTDGLPHGVAPTEVKMMFGTTNGLAIVTCSGQAWVLAQEGNVYGDGAADTDANDKLWHRVSTANNVPLENVVAVRGSYQLFMALTAEGNLYTWGVDTYLGNNTAPANRRYATLMSKPAGVTPKMIGTVGYVNASTYYLLATNGSLYSLGNNATRQIGDGGTTNRNSWYHVTGSRTVGGVTYLLTGNITWISPQEHHHNSSYAINVLTNDGKLWAWGGNYSSMLGGTVDPMSPTFMPGSTTGPYDKTKLNVSDRIIAVETGARSTLLIKECATKFGFVGHRTNGSMSDHPTLNTVIVEYNFGDTSEISVCGAVTSPVLSNRKICKGTTFDLADAVPATLPTGSTGIDWWTDANGTIPVDNPEAVTSGTYYGTFSGFLVKCPTAITISYFTTADPQFKDCESHFISNPLVRHLMQNAADATEKRDQFISR